jgi:hypothetical protein
MSGIAMLTTNERKSPEVIEACNSLYNKEPVTVDDINTLTEIINALEMDILGEMHSRKIKIEGNQPWEVSIETAF